MKKKTFAVIFAVVLTFGVTVGATLAWLTDTTDTVTNTFTVGNVSLTLKESPYDAEEDSYGTPAEGITNVYPALPGDFYKKDPTVKVDENSESCYLFVKYEYTNNASRYYIFDSVFDNQNSGWTKLDVTPSTGETTDGEATIIEVWYRVVEKDATAAEREFELLADLGTVDDVTYASEITLAVNSDTVINGTVEEASKQMLKYTAYAVQKDNLTVTDAWAKVATTATTTN